MNLRAARAIEALRTPHHTMKRVPNTIRQSIAEVIEGQMTALERLRVAFNSFSETASISDGPSLALQQHGPTWEAWKALCNAFAQSPPCGECHLKPGEKCDICGRTAPAEFPRLESAGLRGANEKGRKQLLLPQGGCNAKGCCGLASDCMGPVFKP